MQYIIAQTINHLILEITGKFIDYQNTCSTWYQTPSSQSYKTKNTLWFCSSAQSFHLHLTCQLVSSTTSCLLCKHKRYVQQRKHRGWQKGRDWSLGQESVKHCKALSSNSCLVLEASTQSSIYGEWIHHPLSLSFSQLNSFHISCQVISSACAGDTVELTNLHE